MSHASERPQTPATTGAPGRATRPASRSAATRSDAKKNTLKPATRSKRASEYGSASASPTRTSGARRPQPRELDQRGRRVDPVHARAALRRHGVHPHV